ncbi:MAG: putative toxin-antitoxin system toxin component, PIN family [Bacteroidetes bacterium]|nr:putative toxin-antitoxin system toxin component, PIN family [Bacteroidota bacterium]
MKGNVGLDKIVLDTNNIISLLLKGRLSYLADLKYKLDIEICTCQTQLEELQMVLSRPESNFDKYLKYPVSDFVAFFISLSTIYDVDHSYDRLGDPKDNYLIDLAYTAKSFYIVTGDRKVLAQKHVGRIQIISMTRLGQLLQI